jgi:membrane-associated PAP2 superfamily phosphatase
MGDGMMDMASNWWILSIRYDTLTKLQVAVCVAFLLAMAIIRRGIR